MIAEFAERSNMKRVKVTVVAIVAGDEGDEEVLMGTFPASPRRFNSGNIGFNVNGKLPDPSLTGQENGVNFQLGVNLTAIRSKLWEPVAKVTTKRTGTQSAAAKKRAATKARKAAAAAKAAAEVEAAIA